MVFQMEVLFRFPQNNLTKPCVSFTDLKINLDEIPVVATLTNCFTKFF